MKFPTEFWVPEAWRSLQFGGKRSKVKVTKSSREREPSDDRTV